MAGTGGGHGSLPGCGRQLGGRILDLTGLPDCHGDQHSGGTADRRGDPWVRDSCGRSAPGAQGAPAGGAGRWRAAGAECRARSAATSATPLRRPTACRRFWCLVSAEVVLMSEGGTRQLALAEFLLGPRRTALRPGEVLTAVIIPDAGLQGRSAFLKLGARSHLVISIAMVAARLVWMATGFWTAAVAVGSCSAVAVRLPAVEAALVGAPVAEAAGRVRDVDVAAALSPIDDVRATAAYRRRGGGGTCPARRGGGAGMIAFTLNGARLSRSMPRRPKGCPRRCASGLGRLAPRSAAMRGIAGPARCCWTGRRSVPA